MPPDCHCYGIRRLNPFQGVTQIVATQESRAISPDGINWEIQIKAERPPDMWGVPYMGEPVIQFLRFGTWHHCGGLQRIPAHPLLNLSSMIDAAKGLVEQLERNRPRLPFPLEDRFELWLLDNRDHQPLALLASGIQKEKLNLPSARSWHCANRSGKDFPSPNQDRFRPRHPKETDPHPHMSTLERLVGTHTSPGLAHWFDRDNLGTGRKLLTNDTDETGQRELPAAAFPQRLLKEEWEDPHDRKLVLDYLAWMAPYLLTLQQLSNEARAVIEQQAMKRATLVADNWQLYPRIIDSKAIDAARVEARIRRAGDKPTWPPL